MGFGANVRRAVLWAGTAISFAIASGNQASQARAPSRESNQSPVFRDRVDTVRLTVSVLDTKTGRPIKGLAPTDFAIYEDGSRQEITTFFEDSIDSSKRRLSIGSEQVASSVLQRTFLIVLGRPGDFFEGPVRPYDGVIQFLRHRLLPTDRVAILAFNRATDYTDDHEQIARVVDELKQRSRGVWFDVKNDARRRADIGPSIQAEVDASFQPGAGSTVPLRSATRMLVGTDEFRQNDEVWRPWNGMVMGNDLLKVYAGIEYLRNLNGEKHLICLTESLAGLPVRLLNGPVGLRLDSREDDVRLATRANDAHVALDIIHTSGAPTMSSGRTPGFPGLDGLDSIKSSETIAQLSGGQFTGLRTAAAAMASIDEVTRNGYVVGYQPTNPHFDGRYRHVAVEVTRPGVTVLFPHGYTAQRDAPPIDVRELVTRQRLREAAATDVSQDDIKIQAKASLPAAGGTSQVRVDLMIDTSRISLTESAPRHQGVIELVILCADEKNNVVGKLDQEMTISLDDDHYRQAKANGIPYSALVTISRSVTHVSVLVYDYASDNLGRVDVTVK